MESTPVDDEAIVGDECHIVTAASGGPRFDPDFPRERVDSYSNLLLLCKVHHKMIDDQVSTYPAPRLRKIKESHERWVTEKLDSCASQEKPVRVRQVPEDTPVVFRRIHSGNDLLAIVTNACELAYKHDDLRNEAEEELVGGFLQNAQDWGELGLLSVSDRMHAARSLDESLRELEQEGFWIFGDRERRILEGGIGPETDWPVAHVRVLRSSNPEIIHLDDLANKEGNKL